jgi:hypothetical protein
MSLRTILVCDMEAGCAAPVTHLDEKGFVYCKPHGIYRRGGGYRCRALSGRELRQLTAGEPLREYRRREARP